MNRKKSKTQQISLKGRLITYALVAFMVAPFANWLWQSLRKPSEIVGLLDYQHFKSRTDTWNEYREHFKDNEVGFITAEFLAALAQHETQGNPIARTYWEWDFEKPWHRWYAPASSSVGIMQITDGTFERAKKLCVDDGKVYQDLPRFFETCWFNWTYSRLIPSDAIEMTAALLYRDVKEVIGRRKLRPYLKRRLAAVTHLCGKHKARRIVQSGMNFSAVQRCGSHSLKSYVDSIVNHTLAFQRIEKHSGGRIAKN